MKILTINEIWKNFDASLDLDFKKESDRVSNGVRYNDFYFNGYKLNNDELVKGHGIFAAQSNSHEKRPTVVLVHGIFDSYIQKNWIQHIVGLGFNVLWVDLFSLAGIGTSYPNSLSYCERNNCKDNLNYIEEDPITSPWIIWTSIFRRGIMSLKNFTEVDESKIAVVGGFDSSNIAWQLLALEDLVKCGALLLSSSFYDLKEIGKYEEGSDTLSDSDQMYLAGIASEAYASRVNKPVFLQAVTNSKNCDIDRNYDLLARTQGETNIFIDANAISLPPADAIERIKKYFNAIFNGEETPRAPEIAFEKGENNNLKVIVSLVKGAESPKVFYSVGNTNPYTRAYNQVPLHEENQRLVADIKVFEDNSDVFAFVSANINDIRVTSKVIKTKANRNCEKSSIVFTHEMNKRVFTAINVDNQFDEVRVESFVKKVMGPSDIKGVVCSKPSSSLATFNIFASSVKISDNLILDVFSQEEQKVKIVIVKNYCEEKETKYVAEVNIFAGQNWQRITLKANDFINEIGKALPSFKEEDLSLTYFENSYPIVVNKILFI